MIQALKTASITYYMLWFSYLADSPTHHFIFNIVYTEFIEKYLLFIRIPSQSLTSNYH